MRGGKTELLAYGGDALTAHDADTGKETWRKEFDTGPLPAIMSPNTQASSTPTADR